MKVRISITETGTGCDELLDTEVESLTLTDVTKAISDHWNEQNRQATDGDAEPVDLVPLNWTPNSEQNPNHYHYTLRWTDDYFGTCIVYGIVYTNFI